MTTRQLLSGEGPEEEYPAGIKIGHACRRKAWIERTPQNVLLPGHLVAFLSPGLFSLIRALFRCFRLFVLPVF